MTRLFSTIALALALSLPGISAANDIDDASDALDRGDYAAALELLKGPGAAGNTVAAETLGDMLWHGESLYGSQVRRDPAAAIEWYRRAARQGSPFAAYMLDAIQTTTATAAATPR
jgi:TPR repeat protein